MRNKVIGENTEFYFLENLLVIPKPALIIKLNKWILDKSGKNDPHALVNFGNLDYAVQHLLSHAYSVDRQKNVVFVSRELMFNLAKGHPFAQGNKRTALFVGLLMLIVNALRHYHGESMPTNFTIDLRAYDEMLKAQLMQAIAAWQEKSKIPQLKETIEERMVKEGILKPGQEASESQVKQYLNLVLSKHIRVIQIRRGLHEKR